LRSGETLGAQAYQQIRTFAKHSSGVISDHAVLEAEVLRTLCKNGCVNSADG
jgi:hypothetical protein